MKKPYLLTSLFFIVVFAAGVVFLEWAEITFAFLVLLYFITIIGIRLDDISKQMGKMNHRLYRILNGKAEVGEGMDRRAGAGPLSDVESSLMSINRTLNQILEKMNELSK